MQAWWDSLNVRERLLLSVVVLVALFIVIDVLLIEEFRLKTSEMDTQMEQAREDLEWMKQAVNRIPAGSNQLPTAMTGRIVSYIDQQITRQGLKDKMLQMTPVQDHSVRLRLQNVSFDKLLSFLALVDGAVIIQEVRILPADRKGLVSASLMVSKRGTGSPS